MKYTDIGIQLDYKLARKDWADIIFCDDVPAKLWFGTVPTELGKMTLVGADDSLCYLGFEEKRALEKATKFFPDIPLMRDEKKAQKMADTIMDVWRGKNNAPLSVVVRGTPFQKKVWQTLMKIPTGHAVSYGTVATTIGKPKAVRAVGSAVGANPISLLIPCHRVIQQSGKVENYGWGDAMKQNILRREANQK